MSPLPKKKKTAEELAALRESLGISADGPPPGAPGVAPQDPAVPPTMPEPESIGDAASLPEAKAELQKRVLPAEDPAEEIGPVVREVLGGGGKPVVLEAEEVVVAKAKPVSSLRKSERLPVDQPKKVVSQDSGKLPSRRRRDSEREPLEKPAKPISVGGTSLPTRKHSDQELARLRHSPLPGVEPAAVHLANQTAGLLALMSIYGLGALLVVLAILGAMSARAARFDLPFDWLREAVALPNFSMILYGILFAGVAVMLLGAAWIFFKKPISQYHAAILTIIAVLVLVFGTLYFFPALHGA